MLPHLHQVPVFSEISKIWRQNEQLPADIGDQVTQLKENTESFPRHAFNIHHLGVPVAQGTAGNALYLEAIIPPHTESNALRLNETRGVRPRSKSKVATSQQTEAILDVAERNTFTECHLTTPIGTNNGKKKLHPSTPPNVLSFTDHSPQASVDHIKHQDTHTVSISRHNTVRATLDKTGTPPVHLTPAISQVVSLSTKKAGDGRPVSALRVRKTPSQTSMPPSTSPLPSGLPLQQESSKSTQPQTVQKCRSKSNSNDTTVSIHRQSTVSRPRSRRASVGTASPFKTPSDHSQEYISSGEIEIYSNESFRPVQRQLSAKRSDQMRALIDNAKSTIHFDSHSQDRCSIASEPNSGQIHPSVPNQDKCSTRHHDHKLLSISLAHPSQIAHVAEQHIEESKLQYDASGCIQPNKGISKEYDGGLSNPTPSAPNTVISPISELYETSTLSKMKLRRPLMIGNILQDLQLSHISSEAVSRRLCLIPSNVVCTDKSQSTIQDGVNMQHNVPSQRMMGDALSPGTSNVFNDTTILSNHQPNRTHIISNSSLSKDISRVNSTSDILKMERNMGYIVPASPRKSISSQDSSDAYKKTDFVSPHPPDVSHHTASDILHRHGSVRSRSTTQSCNTTSHRSIDTKPEQLCDSIHIPHPPQNQPLQHNRSTSAHKLVRSRRGSASSINESFSTIQTSKQEHGLDSVSHEILVYGSYNESMSSQPENFKSSVHSLLPQVAEILNKPARPVPPALLAKIEHLRSGHASGVSAHLQPHQGSNGSDYHTLKPSSNLMDEFIEENETDLHAFHTHKGVVVEQPKGLSAILPRLKWRRLFVVYLLSIRLWKSGKALLEPLIQIKYASQTQQNDTLLSMLKTHQGKVDLDLSGQIQELLRGDRNPKATEILERLLTIRIKAMQRYTMDQRLKFCKIMNYACFNGNSLVVKEGNISKSFYFMLSGQVEIFKMKDNKKYRLNTLNAGESFGDHTMNLLNDKRTASVVTTMTSEFLIIDKADFFDITNVWDEKNMSNHMAIISRIPIMDAAGGGFVERIKSFTQIITYEPNEMIILEGSSNVKVYWVLKGTCKCVKLVPFIKRHLGTTYESGDSTVLAPYDPSSPPVLGKDEEIVKQLLQIHEFEFGEHFPDFPPPSDGYNDYVSSFDRFDKVAYTKNLEIEDMSKPNAVASASVVAITKVELMCVNRAEFSHVAPERILRELISQDHIFSVPLLQLQDAYLEKINWANYRKKVTDEVTGRRATRK
ncbi:hypothetical protein QVD99_002753 [Batrachochytrium dendrobatidis]|nr:hypothetical protein O5D80_006980 [Batrachochytrium dendrobatidis]KAK5670982.1 hypothetical protein QVD99_002753 [Batrachochytrium dendrobatidis]